jgi:Swi5
MAEDEVAESPQHSTEEPTEEQKLSSKFDQMNQRLLELEAERRSLLLQLLNEISPSSATSSVNNNTKYLPSVYAHTRPLTPLTPPVETELLTKAQSTIKDHIKLLHRYNETRDIGVGLIGMVAESRKVRVRDCQEEFGVGEGD